MTWNFTRRKTATEPLPTATEQTPSEVGKGRPTPKRKQAEESKAARERIRAKENEEYRAMRSGDTQHMPKAERLPWRVYIRDYVDARFNIGEFFVPSVIVLLAASMLVSTMWPWLSAPLMVVMYGYLLVVLIDVAVMWRKLKKQLIAKFGESSVARGSRSGSYAWMRAAQMRRWRLPKPRYPKRGHWPE